jgi:hypothetical protein
MLHFAEVSKTRPIWLLLARPAAIEALAGHAHDGTSGGRWRPVRVYFARQRDILVTCPRPRQFGVLSLAGPDGAFQILGQILGRILGRVHDR